MMSAHIAHALGGVRREPSGRRCPIHNGRSLTLRDGNGGRVLLACWGRCDRLAVFEELRRRGLLGAGAIGYRAAAAELHKNPRTLAWDPAVTDATIPTPDHKPGCRLVMHWRGDDTSASEGPISSGRAPLAVGTPRVTTPMAQSSKATHWMQRLLQEFAVVQDQAEFERVLAGYLDMLESLSPREHELLFEAVADLRSEQAT